MPVSQGTDKPRKLKDISVIVDPDNGGAEYRKVVQSFQFVPQTTTDSTQGGTPDAIYTDTVLTGYQLQIKFLQDSETLNSFTDWMWLNKGKAVRVAFVPYGGTGWTANIVVPAPPIGGDVGAWLADTVTCGVRGLPQRTVDDPATPQQ